MKNVKYWILSLMALCLVTSCEDDDKDVPQAGNPLIEVKSSFASVHFGDELPFAVHVTDNVSLSTLTVKLYFGEEVVAETLIRTKEYGDYSGTISVPFYKDTPDGTATLEFTLVNTTMKKTTQAVDVPVTRAQYPYLILVTEDATYPMLPTGKANEYAATEAFPSTDLPAYIKTPAVDDKGRELVFGWEGGAVAEGVTTNIPYVSPVGGAYSVTFNTKTFETGPFFELLFNGAGMSMIDKENYEINVDLTQGQEIVVEGIDDIADWWIDQDFLKVKEAGKYTFAPIAGRYKFTANLALKYFIVEAMTGNAQASLQEDGTGAIWVIGQNVGKPSVAENVIGWTDSKAICMAPIGGKKYQLTLVAGETIDTDAVNFKFFHQKGWGGEFGGEALTSTGDIIYVNAGDSDNGNLRLVDNKPLEAGATYVFVVDVSAGIDAGILSVTKK